MSIVYMSQGAATDLTGFYPFCRNLSGLEGQIPIFSVLGYNIDRGRQIR
jgi:hypothetical protein